MDYKEKYEMALSRAKNLHKDAIDMGETLRAKQCEIIFPELAEPEDERIRKALIAVLKSDFESDTTIYDISVGEIIAWLEKQSQVKESLISQHENKTCKENDDSLTSEDEKIRNLIIDLVNARANDNDVEPMISWLEKQGGKDKLIQELGDYKVKYTQKVLGQYLENQGEKPINDTDEEIVEAVQNTSVLDMVEPRFKVGDWITDGNITIQIEAIKNDCYLYCGDCALYSTKTADKVYHLWTIQDAKNGDVLVYGDNPSDHHLRIIMLFKSMRTFNSAFNHFHIFDDEFRINDWCDCGKTAHPATKEQRDLLFKKMIDAGYEWDAEKKELKKMKVTSSTYCSGNCKGYQETGKCFADGECDSKRKYDNILDSCEIEHIEDGKYYYCIKDYYAGGNKRASKGDVIQAHRGMCMMGLGTNANEYFLPVKRCSLSFVEHIDV